MENAIRAWVTITSRGVSQEDLNLVEAMFDQLYANAREYLTNKKK